nr:uncharacterized protein LOC117279451 [Nicotiana tomentosiformis]
MPLRRFCGRTTPCAIYRFLQLTGSGVLRLHIFEQRLRGNLLRPHIFGLRPHNSSTVRNSQRLLDLRYFNQRIQFKTKRPNQSISYKYCKKPGHTIEKCYKLHEFPPDLKFNKNKRSASCVHIDASSSGLPSTPSQGSKTLDISAYGFTQEQYQHLMSLLQQSHIYPGANNDLSFGENTAYANFADLPNSSPSPTSAPYPPSPIPPHHVVPNSPSFTTDLPSTSPLVISHTPSVSLPVRHSFRISNPPPHLKDYVFPFFATKAPASLASKVTSAEFHMHEPQFYQHVASYLACQKAMLKEFQALDANHTWDIVPFPFTRSLYLANRSTRSNKGLMVPLKAFFYIYLFLFSIVLKAKEVSSSSSFLTVLTVYVDDIFLADDDVSELDVVKAFLDAQFKIKDIRTIHYFGTGSYYIFSWFSHGSVKLLADMGEPLSDLSTYRRIVGKLNFLQHTRPDIAFSVQHLSQFLPAPQVPHMFAAIHVLRYLFATPVMGILLFPGVDFSLKAYSDSDWTACAMSRMSIAGNFITLGGCPVSWKSKKQQTVSLSSTKDEYRALRQVVAEVSWLIWLLADFGVSISIPVSIFCDNQAALHIAKNPAFHERTKHIEIDYHYVRDSVISGLISLHYVASAE